MTHLLGRYSRVDYDDNIWNYLKNKNWAKKATYESILLMVLICSGLLVEYLEKDRKDRKEKGQLYQLLFMYLFLYTGLSILTIYPHIHIKDIIKGNIILLSGACLIGVFTFCISQLLDTYKLKPFKVLNLTNRELAFWVTLLHYFVPLIFSNVVWYITTDYTTQAMPYEPYETNEYPSNDYYNILLLNVFEELEKLSKTQCNKDACKNDYLNVFKDYLIGILGEKFEKLALKYHSDKYKFECINDIEEIKEKVTENYHTDIFNFNYINDDIKEIKKKVSEMATENFIEFCKKKKELKSFFNSHIETIHMLLENGFFTHPEQKRMLYELEYLVEVLEYKHDKNKEFHPESESLSDLYSIISELVFKNREVTYEYIVKSYIYDVEFDLIEYYIYATTSNAAKKIIYDEYGPKTWADALAEKILKLITPKDHYYISVKEK